MKRRQPRPQPTIDLLLRENKFLSITLYMVAVLSVCVALSRLVLECGEISLLLSWPGRARCTCLFRPGASSKCCDVKTD